MELSLKDQFDYIVVNEILDNAIEETSELIKRIIKKE
jgi:guanylate kinase